MRWLVLIVFSLFASAAIAQSAVENAGPSWSQIAAWLGAGMASLIGVWATRLEQRIARETRRREDELALLAKRLDTHISRADTRAADMLQKSAQNTLALSELRLEMARSLTNHPTKSDFERGLDRLTTQVEGMRDKLETLIAGQRHA